MNVASKDLCRELYELSGWDNTLTGGRERWVVLPNGSKDTLRLDEVRANGLDKYIWYRGTPSYDLGFLLRKLPNKGASHHRSFRLEHDHWDDNGLVWSACYIDNDDNDLSAVEGLLEYAPTPEDAACKLLIELFKSKVLTP